MEYIVLFLVAGAGLLFFVLLILFIAGYGKAKTSKREAERSQAFQQGNMGRARVIELRRAEAQRSNEFELFKLMLEVVPDNSRPAFSAAVVWEIEPLFVHSLRAGASFPVKINPDDTRQVFPNTPGMKYSYRYQHAYLGIENDFEPQRVIAAQNLPPAAPRAKTIYRRRSKAFLFRLPLWEVAINLNNRKYAPRAKARAVIAIGDSATGLIAVGQVARGIVAVGGISFGLLSIGGISFGIGSLGLLSFGPAALGIIGAGVLAFGGVSFGLISFALLPFGTYVFGKDFQIPVLLQLFENFNALTGLNYKPFDYVFIVAAAGFAIFMLTMIAKVPVSRMLSPNDNSLESPRR